jgi:alpha-glucosidase
MKIYQYLHSSHVFLAEDLIADQHLNTVPSFALSTPITIEDSLAVDISDLDTPVVPEIVTRDNTFHVDVSVPCGTSFYGGGEVAHSLMLNHKKMLLWNNDNAEYGRHSENLYQSTPYVMGVLPGGDAFGLIFDTTYPIKINLSDDKVEVISDFVELDGKVVKFPVVMFCCDTPQRAVMTLAELTGKMNLPPLWSLGYQQCRWGYYPDDVVRELATEFRTRKIPCDVIWLDIDYMDGYRIFTFDKNTFPEPKKLNDDLHEMGFHSVWMIDPGVKKEENYFVYDSGTEGNHWVMDNKNSEPYTGIVWPGECVFPDFTKEDTRNWWANLYTDFMAQGVDGVWNDMNEPACFDKILKTMEHDAIHNGYDGPHLHARFHNVYGNLMAKATSEGIKKANPEKRPFVLSRANFLGGQKYAATWTGDNQSSWDHLHLSIPMVLNLGLSGQPFSGPDIGGFGASPETANATPDMFGRWIGFGAFLPFARGHTHLTTLPHEPWAFGSEIEEVSRVSIGRRYLLLPYFYSLFREASMNGMPVLRPLFFRDSKDKELRNEDRGFTVGDNLMVLVNVNEDFSEVKHALPKNEMWLDFDIDGHHNRHLPTLKTRAGSIIPMGPMREYVNQRDLDEITLIITFGDKSHATGELYEDEGDGYGHLEGEYLHTTFSAHIHNRQIKLHTHQKGHLNRPSRPLHIKFVDFPGHFHNDIYETTFPTQLTTIDLPSTSKL